MFDRNWSVDLTDLANPAAYLERKLRESLETPDLMDPMSAYIYLNTRRQAVREAAKQRPLMRLWDKNMRYIGPITKEKSVTVEEVMADSGTATIALRHDTVLTNFLIYDRRAEEDIHITIDPDPHNRTWETRWGGKLTAASTTRNPDGTHTVELEATHNREHLKHILAAANPLLPPEYQLPKSWLLPWNLRTALGITVGINLFRQYFPGMNIWANLFNPGSWVDTRLLNVTPMNWPVCPQFINPLTDKSRTSVVSSTWDDIHTISAGPMKDAGVMAKAYTWLPEDTTSPHPELGKLGDALARPTRPQVVLAFEDKSGVTGLTGTLLDGPINLIAATADDLITETIIPLDLGDKDNDGKVDPFFRKLLGAAPAKPRVVFREGEHTGIVMSKRTLKAATAKTIHTGSRSPGWINQLQTFGIKFGLSQLQTVVTTGFGAQEGSAPIGSGLEELYQGQLDDCVSGDTLVNGPDGEERIDVLARRGVPFRVWSVTPFGRKVAAHASLAFLKGTAEMFEYTLDDGRSITATADHRFLTDIGFVRGGDLLPGARVATTGINRLAVNAIDVPAVEVHEDAFAAVPETDDLRYRFVVSVRSAGVGEFYDMHVPGWENYAANGFWNHNTAFAWQRFTDPRRSILMGDYGYLEHRERGSGSAYTIAGVLDLRTGHFKTKGSTTFKTEIVNGRPWSLFEHFNLGDRLAFQLGNALHVDQLTGWRMSYDVGNPLRYELSLGQDLDDDDPFARGIQTLAAFWNVFGAFLGSGHLF